MIALTVPTVTARPWGPVGAAGTITAAVKLPFASVAGEGRGSAEIPPIVIAPIRRKAGKSLPVTVIGAPGSPELGVAVTLALGTMWVALAPAINPLMVAVTVFVDGMFADDGTWKVALKLPSRSAKMVTTCVPA